MGYREILEATDIFLGKSCFSDWADLYRNVWSREESARYMLWNVVKSEEAAQEKMRRSLAWEKCHPSYTVYERASGQAIGWAGIAEVAPGIWEDTGIALGPDYTGRGYGRQVLNALVRYCREELGAATFVCACRAENRPCRSMLLACGFQYDRAQGRTDPRDGRAYRLEFYKKRLQEP